ncbi:hypothetical protein [Microvirga ossetica]|nr:hypothetical protein [Microvirga ossetica]
MTMQAITPTDGSAIGSRPIAVRAARASATGLSHTIADAGTVTSPLVPWNPCDAHMAAVVGVPTLLYLPFCLFNIA